MYKKRPMRPRRLTEAEAFAWFMPGPPPPPDQCWIWTSSYHGNGWGQFGVTVDGQHKNAAAHRAAYRIYHGPVPPGLLVLQTCKNHRCCQPAHLYAGPRTRKPKTYKTPLTLEQRFWKRVDKDGPISPILGTPCWMWQPVKRHWDGTELRMTGLPDLFVGGKRTSAIRYSYELATGTTVPRRKRVLRRCKNRQCVNPEHLTLDPDPKPRYRRRRIPSEPHFGPPRPGGQQAPALKEHNKSRQQEAAKQRIAAARAAIPVIRQTKPTLRLPAEVKDNYLVTLAARIEHPDATLADLGYRLGVTKDAYAAALRRALAMAHQ